MEKRDIIVIGASAGGMEALCKLLAALPSELPASVFVVQHVGSSSVLGEVLGRCGPLRTITPEDGDKIEQGRVYVAPSDHHLLLLDGHMQLSRAPRENRHRPSVDVLFRSAARNFRGRVIAVVLSGALDDGAAGAIAVKARHGLVIVQNDAQVPTMPNAVCHAVKVDYSLPLAEIPSVLAKLVRQKVPRVKTGPPSRKTRMITAARNGQDGKPLAFTCPECNGPMFQVKTSKEFSQYHCLIGHLYSAEGLTVAHQEALERALLISVRMLRERALVHQALVNRSFNSSADAEARSQEVADTSSRDAALLQEILEHI